LSTLKKINIHSTSNKLTLSMGRRSTLRWSSNYPLLWNLKDHNHVHKSPALQPIQI